MPGWNAPGPLSGTARVGLGWGWLAGRPGVRAGQGDGVRAAGDRAGAASRSGALTRRASAAAAFTAPGSSALITTTGADTNNCRARPAASCPAEEPVRTTVAEEGSCVRATIGLRGVPGWGCADEAARDPPPEQAVRPSARMDSAARIVPPRCLRM